MGFLMEKESKFGKMDSNTWDHTNTVLFKDKENLSMQMVLIMRVTSSMTRNMAGEFLHGQMDASMKANGLTDIKKE